MVTEKVLPNLYRFEIPLLENPLKAINSYLILGNERNLIVDTGMNRKECMDAMCAGLEELRVDLKKTDFLITHLHVDHIGLVSRLVTDSSKIYFSKIGAELMSSAPDFDKFVCFGRANGFPENDLLAAVRDHPAHKYGWDSRLTFFTLKDKDTLGIGDYSFTCVETPGHTRGHMCLYEESRKVFISGDHILDTITPHIEAWSDDSNPLEEYLSSLDKVSGFDIELVLPGHGAVFTTCNKRIQELKDHHKKRAEELLSLLGEGSKNAYQVASQMSWNTNYDSWELFPLSQKWFAVGETVAHLKYLETHGLVQRKISGQQILFSLNLSASQYVSTKERR